MSTGRIDVHQHVIPPFYRDWLVGRGIDLGRRLPAWSTDSTVAMMDGHRIAAGVLSVSTPGVHLGPGEDAEARLRAREANEFLAEVVKDRPDRFGFFATLTLPDVGGAVAEAEYALDVLGAHGVLLLANTHGQYLGDPALEPLMAELSRRGTVALVHPSQLPGPGVPGVPAYVADYLLDTTRAAVNLVRNGVLTRHPGVRFVLAHGGGFLPYASHRVAHAPNVWGERTLEQVLAELRRFHFDTALASSPASLPSLLAFADPANILYGSDWPFATDDIDYFTGGLQAHPLSEERRAAIDSGNARRLFAGAAFLS